MDVLRLKRCSIAFHFKTGSGVASSLRAFNEALTLLSNYHKGTLVIVQCGTRQTVLFAAVRQNELTSFVPLSFLILLPLIHSFFFFFFFFYNFCVSILHLFYPFQPHHCSVHPPHLPSFSPPFFKQQQGCLTYQRLCVSLIKRSAKEVNMGQEIGMSRRCLILPDLTQKYADLNCKCTH